MPENIKNQPDPAPPELYISPRPQISVSLINSDEVEISTASIGSDYQTVEHESVVIPLDLAVDVAQALMNLADRNKF